MPFWIIIGACLAVFVMLVAVAGSFGYLGSGMPAAVQSTPAAELDDDFTASDVDALRFSQEFRGYRMTQVDEVLTALQERLKAQEATIAELRSAPPSESPRDTGDMSPT